MARSTAAKAPSRRRRNDERSPPPGLSKDLALLHLALHLLDGGSFTYQVLCDDYRLTRRTAERYVRALKDVGLPVEQVRDGRTSKFQLSAHRAHKKRVEAIDIPPSAARPLSLLLVAASLLPEHLGVREAVDATVRSALRLHGQKAQHQLRVLENAIVVLENDAKNYQGRADLFQLLLDTVLERRRLDVMYRSPIGSNEVRRIFAASIGLYHGGLYLLAVDADAPSHLPTWLAMERIVSVLDDGKDESTPRMKQDVRERALQHARRRWGPSRPKRAGADVDDTTLITLHFRAEVAPYVLARPWHDAAEFERWDDGGVRMAIRLEGDVNMLESWIRSWGEHVQILRPRWLAERVALNLERAALSHRLGPQRFRDELTAVDTVEESQ